MLPMFLALLATLSAHAASVPQVEWQRGFGGTNTDILAGLHLTSDGRYLLAGSSYSGATGNKTSTNSGDYDGWIIGLDANGNKLWDWSYGGTNTDTLRTVRQTTNGEVLVAGISFSKASGSKTSTNYGSSDGWLIRFNTNGTKLRDQAFGGTSIDSFGPLLLTDDGGCLVGGARSPVTNVTYAGELTFSRLQKCQ